MFLFRFFKKLHHDFYSHFRFTEKLCDDSTEFPSTLPIVTSLDCPIPVSLSLKLQLSRGFLTPSQIVQQPARPPHSVTLPSSILCRTYLCWNYYLCICLFTGSLYQHVSSWRVGTHRQVHCCFPGPRAVAGT